MPSRIVVSLFALLMFACAGRETHRDAAHPPIAATAPPLVSTTDNTASTSPPTSSAAVVAPTAAAATGIATAEGDEPGVTLALKELKRGSGGIVSLKFVITNGTSKKLGFGYSYADPDHEVADFGSVGGAQLIDPVGKKKYFVARDAEGKCVCSRGIKDLAPGAAVNAWAKFPAPPGDVQKISVVLPHFSPMDDVPISQ